MENMTGAKRVGEAGAAGLGGEAAPLGEEQPPTPRLGNSGGPRLAGSRRVGAGPGLHFPYCPSALMYAVLSPAPCV